MQRPNFEPLPSTQSFQSLFASFTLKKIIRSQWKTIYCYLLTPHIQTGLSQFLHPSRQFSSHGHSQITFLNRDGWFLKVIGGNHYQVMWQYLPLLHLVLTSTHVNTQVLALIGQLTIHWSIESSHFFLQIWLCWGTLNKNSIIIHVKRLRLKCRFKCGCWWKLYVGEKLSPKK